MHVFEYEDEEKQNDDVGEGIGDVGGEEPIPLLDDKIEIQEFDENEIAKDHEIIEDADDFGLPKMMVDCPIQVGMSTQVFDAQRAWVITEEPSHCDDKETEHSPSLLGQNGQHQDQPPDHPVDHRDHHNKWLHL